MQESFPERKTDRASSEGQRGQPDRGGREGRTSGQAAPPLAPGARALCRLEEEEEGRRDAGGPRGEDSGRPSRRQVLKGSLPIGSLEIFMCIG